MDFVIHPMQRRDWKPVKAIYAEGLATGLAAFATAPPLWKSWDAGHLPIGRRVARAAEGAVIGWAALAPVPDT